MLTREPRGDLRMPWSTLYHQDNYPALQRVKARWDPLDVFRHAMSVVAGGVDAGAFEGATTTGGER